MIGLEVAIEKEETGGLIKQFGSNHRKKGGKQ